MVYALIGYKRYLQHCKVPPEDYNHVYQNVYLVYTIIVYPFRTTVATSPLEEISHGKLVLVFHFQVFALWLLSAEKYVQEHAVAMYALLPAMGGANAELVIRAIDEMVQYYQNDGHTLGRELRWLGIVLRRAEIVPLEEKRVIEERLSMYDDLMEKDPKMIQIRAESEAKGARMMIIAFVQMRFPALLEQARKKVKRVTTADALQQLFQQLMNAADEDAARSLLT